MFIELGVSVAYIVILIKLGEVHPDYRKAAMFLIPGVGTDVLGIILIFVLLSGTSTELPLWYSGIDTVAGLIGIYGTYLEFMSHADVTAKVDPQQSNQWRNLWKYIVIFCLITIFSVFFALIPVLGLIIVIVGAIGIVVCSILKLVYLYRTAKLFQAYGA